MGKVYWLNNSVTFSGKPMGSEEFLNQKIEALGINIDRRLKVSYMWPYDRYILFYNNWKVKVVVND